MRRMKRFFENEDGLAMLQISISLGFVAIAIIIVLFVMSAGGTSLVV